MAIELFTGTLGVGVGVLIALALLKYSGYVDLVKKELSYIADGAVFLILAAVLPSLGEALGATLMMVVTWITVIFTIIAFLLILVAAIGMAVNLVKKIR